MHKKFPVIVTSATIATVCSAAALGQSVSEQFPTANPPEVPDVEVIGHILKPAQLEVTEERVQRLQLPEGFEIAIFADGLENPRMLAVHESGAVFVTRREVGDVVRLVDEDGDGRADTETVVAEQEEAHGIAIDGSTLYLVTVRELYRADIDENGDLGELELLIDDLPDGGQHPNRTIVVGPDGKLYLSVGSTCNACAETNPESATILQVEPDGSDRRVFASGLRNTIGFGFVPGNGALFGMDHGIDWLGDNEQHEELNRIEDGAQYGWPYVYDDGRFNPADEPPADQSWADWAEQSTEPVGFYTPHAAPMQWAFYTGDQFPEAYRGDAFVTMRGSWNRKPPSGYEIVRIDFEDGEPVSFEPFVTGFLMQEGGQWGFLSRLAGVAQAGDGSLLVSDDTNGVIYRISYTGEADAEAAQGMTPTNSEGAEVRVEGGPGR
ncbi:PQQ-dependent sugar dehydrogenase [Gilvimarinus sp. F26214L]|uniref:PQQ-dependent sugar dehydrogenase n=1 Tax=Gilvimarinus sp. DZF01 TaxID=3461371 RepID=UPI004045D4C3